MKFVHQLPSKTKLLSHACKHKHTDMIWTSDLSYHTVSKLCIFVSWLFWLDTFCTIIFFNSWERERELRKDVPGPRKQEIVWRIKKLHNFLNFLKSATASLRLFKNATKKQKNKKQKTNEKMVIHLFKKCNYITETATTSLRCDKKLHYTCMWIHHIRFGNSCLVNVVYAKPTWKLANSQSNILLFQGDN